MIGEIFNAKEFVIKLKATIQSTGKMGFTADTIQQLDLTSDSSIRLAHDSDRKDIMYLSVLHHLDDTAFPILKAGNYVYINTKQLFDKLKFDYQKYNYMFDLTRFPEGDEIMQGECYQMTMRTTSRKTTE